MESFKYTYDYRTRKLCLGIKPLMNVLSFFLCNIRAGMIVELRK